MICENTNAFPQTWEKMKRRFIPWRPGSLYKILHEELSRTSHPLALVVGFSPLLDMGNIGMVCWRETNWMWGKTNWVTSHDCWDIIGYKDAWGCGAAVWRWDSLSPPECLAWVTRRKYPRGHCPDQQQHGNWRSGLNQIQSYWHMWIFPGKTCDLKNINNNNKTHLICPVRIEKT